MSAGPQFSSAFGDATGPAVAQVTGHGGGPRILFVCTANISRSPYAEMRLRHLLGPATSWAVASAGVPGTVDLVMDPGMARLATERGVDPDECEAFRSRPVTGRLLARTALVVTMEDAHRRRLIDDHPTMVDRIVTLGQLAVGAKALDTRGPDPTRGAISLVTALDALRTPAVAKDDVPDPYRRGARAATRAADLIDASLVTVAPLLMRV